MPADAAEPLVLAVAEACNNAILHAAGDDFTVSVVIENGRALVTVADHGARLRPPGQPRRCRARRPPDSAGWP